MHLKKGSAHWRQLVVLRSPKVSFPQILRSFTVSKGMALSVLYLLARTLFMSYRVGCNVCEAKLRKATIRFLLVLPSVCNSSAPTGWIFMYLNFFFVSKVIKLIKI